MKQLLITLTLSLILLTGCNTETPPQDEVKEEVKEEVREGVKVIEVNYPKNRKEAIGSGYFKDDESIYFHSILIEDVDYDSFEGLEAPFGKDKNSMYYRGTKLYEDVDLSEEDPFAGDYIVTGYISIIDRSCEENCMSDPYSVDYAFFNITDAKTKNIYLHVGNTGNSYIGEAMFGLGCYNETENKIHSSNYGLEGSASNSITGEDLEKLLASSKENPVNFKITKPSEGAGGGAPVCYSHFRDFEVLD